MALPAEYENLKFVGDGAFAQVYKVRHRTLKYVRAVKISKQYINDEQDPAYIKFLNECSVLLRLGSGGHPNIVRIFNPRLVDHSAMVEMDYVDGETMCSYLEKEVFVSMDEFMRFAHEMIDALAYCHHDIYKFLMDANSDDIPLDPDDAQRLLISPEKERELVSRYAVIHNDLHSNNIIRRRYDGRYVLLDFGLAIQNGNCIKSSSRRDGAPEYQAPEKFDTGNVSAATDVYSLGVLLFEMLAGRVPYPLVGMEERNPIAVISEVQEAHRSAEIPEIAPLRMEAFQKKYPGHIYVLDYPPELERIIRKCLSKNIKDRYADAYELRKDFDKLLHPELNSESPEYGLARARARINELESEVQRLTAEKEDVFQAYMKLENNLKK